MTAYDTTMNFQYPSETSFEDLSSSYAPYKTTSPHTGISPAMGNQEFSALLEAFTNNPGEDYSSSLFSQQNPSKAAQGNLNSEFNAAWSMADSQANSLSQMESNYSPKSSIVSSESSGMHTTSTSVGVLPNSGGASPYHPCTSLYAPPEMYPFSNRPTSQTVPYLEAMAAAPLPISSSMAFPPIEGYSFDPHNSQMSRQDSTRSFFEGPHLSGLTLDSPRNSISAGSSTPSSSQNSPTTPLSTYSADNSLAFHPYQQKFTTLNANGVQVHTQPYYLPHSHGTVNPLSMSVPASFSRAQHEDTSRNVLQSSVRPHGRMSSAGLMDQIVSSRKVAASPIPGSIAQGSGLPAVLQKEKKGRRSRANTKTSPTPPATPGRLGLRKGSLDITHLETILSGHTTPTSETGPGQTVSSVGPHRTPSKRTHSSDCLPQQAMSPANAATPRRPSTLRRTASHTPGSSPRDSLISPADLKASQRAQTAAQSTMATAMQPAQKARIAASANLEFPGGMGMARAQSSPGLVLTSSLTRQPTVALELMSPVNTDHAKRRSNTISALHMSPLSMSVGRRSSGLASPNTPVSFAEALLALDQISSFLNYQASIISSNSNATADNVLGTYEQLQGIEDLKRRVHSTLSFPA